ncbi:hypothetical protein EDC04DRAFT_2614403 [Pisolithus marmoratus]|nr:hypothetical protein EDC04DRAFT_2614403 [Pisolithus marmoratus]
MTHSLITLFSYEILPAVPVDAWVASMYDLGDWNCVTKLLYCYDDGVSGNTECWRMGDKVDIFSMKYIYRAACCNSKRNYKRAQISLSYGTQVVSPTEWSDDVDPDGFSWCFTGNRPQAYRWSGTQQYNNPPPLACADTLERARSYSKFARTTRTWRSRSRKEQQSLRGWRVRSGADAGERYLGI